MLGAVALAGAASLHPRISVDRPVFRYLFILDITQSMNARDYELDGRPIDRLSYARHAVRTALLALPCGSEAGLGVFTTKNTEILFDPIETCSHLPVALDVLEHVDWRMAWAGDSYIADGLFSALRGLSARPAPVRLVFLSDGQQTPANAIPPKYSGTRGEIPGLIIGVGGDRPVPIPRLDLDNRQGGIWQAGDVAAPVSSTAYENDPLGELAEESGREGPYMTRVFENRLQRLAELTGLDYRRLTNPEAFARLLLDERNAEYRSVPTDIAPALTVLAWLLVVGSYAGRIDSLRRRWRLALPALGQRLGTGFSPPRGRRARLSRHRREA